MADSRFLKTQLFEIINAKNPAMLKHFLDAHKGKIDLEASGDDDYGWKPLCLAALHGQIEMVQYLLAAGARRNATSLTGNTALHCAATLAASDDFAERRVAYAIMRLLKTNNELMATNYENESAQQICRVQDQLNEMIRTKRVDLVREFLAMAEGIVDINGKDTQYNTALSVAARLGDKAMVEFLLGVNASKRITISGGNLPIHCAAELASSEDFSKRDAGFAVMRVLKSSDNDLRVTNYENKSPYEISCVQDNFSGVIKTGSIELVRNFLLSAADIIDINGRDSELNTPLSIAASRGDKPMVEFLLQAGASRRITIREGNLPIHCAAILASSDDYEKRAAGYAVMKVLKSADSDLTVTNYNSKSPYDLCGVQDQLSEAVRSGRIEFVRDFLNIADGIARIDARDSQFRTPLGVAARRGDMPMVEFLLQRGAQRRVTSSNGNMPIHLAAELAGRTDNIETMTSAYAIMKILMTQNDDLTLTNYDSKSALDLCNVQDQLSNSVKSKSIDEVEQFLQIANGIVDINRKDSNFMTALCHATVNGHANMITLLLGKGANARGTGPNGNLPIHYAAALVASCNDSEKNAGIAAMQLLFKDRSDLTFTNYEGKCALDLCGEASTIESKLLMKAGDNRPAALLNPQVNPQVFFQPKVNDRYEKLYQAVVNGEADKVDKYMRNGMDCNYIYDNKPHQTLVNYLVAETDLDENQRNILRILLDNCADVSLRDKTRFNAMENFLNRSDISGFRSDKVEFIVDMLMGKRKGYDVN